MNALGNVSDNTIFGNKEEIDIDIVIANEKARVASGQLAYERADCIAFIGARFEDVVGFPSAKIVENLIADVTDGELHNSAITNSFCATFGNYKQQYDKFNDKMRWVSVAGDVAGLRANTNTKLNSWWASAGLDRGQIKNAQKIAFNPNLGQRDFLYKNKINPVVSFPGQGNAIVWGQKTLQSKPSAFDRINVRGLFNTLERAISRMAKYYLFEFNDEFTRNRFVGTIRPFLEQVKAGRGVYDFYVRCDKSNNTSAVIDANQFIADIAVKPTRVAEFITLNFVAVGTGVSFSEIFV
jgi:phage tail sheath protein FI